MKCFPLFNEKFELEEFEWSKLKLELDFIQRWAWYKNYDRFLDKFRKYEKYISKIKDENFIDAYNSLEPATKEVFWCITEHDTIDDSSIEKNIDLDFFIDSSINILIQKGLITARKDEDFYFYGSYVYSADERFSDIKKMIEDDKRMDNKKIIIDFSNGESEELTLNENLSDDLLEEALRRMDLQELDDIYGDAYETGNKEIDRK